MGSGRSRIASCRLKSALLIPMPIASDSAAVDVKRGLRRNRRSPYRMSFSTVSTNAPARTSLTCPVIVSTRPSSSVAARRASSERMPFRIFSSTSSSKMVRTSSSSSRSTSPRRTTLRQRLDMRDSRDTVDLQSGFKRAGDGHDDSIPLHRFFSELAAAGPRQAVILRPPIVLGGLPARSEPASFFEPVESGKQRAGLHDERSAGDLFDTAGHAQSVQLAGRQRFQNQKIEGSLKQGRTPFRHLPSPLSTSYTSGRPKGSWRATTNRVLKWL